MAISSLRLIPAAAVAMAVGFLGFSVLGLAAATEPAQASLEPQWFQIAPRHVGDLQTFEWSATTRSDHGDQQYTYAWTVQWGPEEPWLDGRDGSWHAAHPRLSEPITHRGDTSDYQWDLQVSQWHHSEDNRLMGFRMNDQLVWNYTTGVPLLQTGGTLQQNGTYLGWSDGQVCALDNLLRTGLHLVPTISLVDPCLSVLAEPLEFTVGRGDVDGVATVRFTAELERSTLIVDYHEDLPDAWQIQHVGKGPQTASNFAVDTGAGYTQTTKLVAFEPGAGPWRTGLVLPDPLDLPAIQVAARHPWGPEEAGVDHPFPASVAWQAAVESAAFSDFRDFMAAHPEALAREGDYQEARTDNQTSRTWTFHVQDDAAAFVVFSTQGEAPPGAQVTDLLGLDPVPTAPLFTYDAQGFPGQVRGCGHGHGAPTGPKAGDSLATVASVMARWKATVGATQEANSWGFDCDLVTAGWSQQAGTRDANEVVDGGLGLSGTVSMLAVNSTGSPLHVVERSSSTRHTSPLPRPGQAAPAVDDSKAVQPAKSLSFSSAGMTWVAPTTPAASGAAAASLVAGLLYWLWPTFKGGAAGLFSRIETPRLLQHPTRRAIADAVEASPGIHYQAIVRLVGGGKGAVDHHLRKLVAAGLLLRHQGAGFTCYFPPKVDRRVTAAAGMLKSEGARRVLAAAQAHPGATSAELAAVTGLDASTVSHHVHRLAAAGVLHATKVGRTLVVQPTFLASQVTAASAA